LNGVNNEWAIAQLDDFVRATELTYIPSPPGSVGFHAYRTAEPEEDVVRRAHVVELILDRSVPRWRNLEVDNNRKKWALHREASIRAREALVRADEIRRNLGDDAPEISAASLHPWVWDGASSLWRSGHFRSAVEDAAKKVNAETQNKLGRRDVSETKLFQEGFSLDPPQPGRPRLRRMQADGSDTYKSVQRGAMALAEGIFAGVRNPFNHQDPTDIDEHVALEYLAVLSVIARWVDDAAVEQAT